MKKEAQHPATMKLPGGVILLCWIIPPGGFLFYGQTGVRMVLVTEARMGILGSLPNPKI